jgi:hypothetical protein
LLGQVVVGSTTNTETTKHRRHVKSYMLVSRQSHTAVSRTFFRISCCVKSTLLC